MRFRDRFFISCFSLSLGFNIVIRVSKTQLLLQVPEKDSRKQTRAEEDANYGDNIPAVYKPVSGPVGLVSGLRQSLRPDQDYDQDKGMAEEPDP